MPKVTVITRKVRSSPGSPLTPSCMAVGGWALCFGRAGGAPHPSLKSSLEDRIYNVAPTRCSDVHSHLREKPGKNTDWERPLDYTHILSALASWPQDTGPSVALVGHSGFLSSFHLASWISQGSDLVGSGSNFQHLGLF